MLGSGFYGESIENFIGPGWTVRDKLLQHLKDVAERHRQAFASALYKQGYDVAVPGISNPDPRPALADRAAPPSLRRGSKAALSIGHHLTLDPIVGLFETLAQRSRGLPIELFLDQAIIGISTSNP